MEHLVNLNGLVLYVQDIDASLSFYATLGFVVHEDETGQVGMARLNNFLIKFIDARTAQEPEFAAEANARPKGGGLFAYVQVTEIDRYYQQLVDQGLTPRTKPRDWPWGSREFVVRDPDGYKLVFYELTSL